MKHLINRGLPLLLAAVLLLTGVACNASTYRADVASSEITEAAKDAIGLSSDYFDASAETYDVFFGAEAAFAAVEDCNIVYHVTETNVDQFGVFRAKILITAIPNFNADDVYILDVKAVNSVPWRITPATYPAVREVIDIVDNHALHSVILSLNSNTILIVIDKRRHLSVETEVF